MKLALWLKLSLVALTFILLIGGILWIKQMFYHPLELVHIVDRTNIVGYIEWPKAQTTTIISQLLAKDSSGTLTNLARSLNCKLSECGWWGSANALVFRQENNRTLTEFYLYQPDFELLRADWEVLTSGKQELVLGDMRYRLQLHETWAVVSPRTQLPTTPIVADLPWTTSALASAWNHNAATGYCTVHCVTFLTEKLGIDFTFFHAFINDTIDYVTFAVQSDTDNLTIDYEQHFLSSFQAPITSSTQSVRVNMAANEWLWANGDHLASKVNGILAEGQNRGLWKTIADNAATTSWGIALTEFSTALGDVPYEIHLAKPLTQSTLVITMTDNEWQNFKQRLTTSATKVLPLLFPQKIALPIPDGTTGYELIKNANLSYQWTTKDSIDSFIVTEGNKQLLTIYFTHQDQKIVISMFAYPTISSTSAICFTTPNTIETTAWYNGTNLYVMALREISWDKTKGTLVISDTLPTCTQDNNSLLFRQ